MNVRGSIFLATYNICFTVIGIEQCVFHFFILFVVCNVFASFYKPQQSWHFSRPISEKRRSSLIANRLKGNGRPFFLRMSNTGFPLACSLWRCHTTFLFPTSAIKNKQNYTLSQINNNYNGGSIVSHLCSFLAL